MSTQNKWAAWQNVKPEQKKEVETKIVEKEISTKEEGTTKTEEIIAKTEEITPQVEKEVLVGVKKIKKTN